MNNTLIYTLPQWFVFAGVFAVAYGWIEDKKPFRLIGAMVFILLGIFALFILSGDYFASARFVTPDELATEQLEEDTLEAVPFQVRLFPAYISFLASAVLAIPALFFEIRNNRKFRLFIILTMLAALLGFFIIVGNLKQI